MNSNDPLGLEELNSLPEVLPDSIPEAEAILEPILSEEMLDLGTVPSSSPILEEESTALENSGDDRLIEEDTPEIVTPSVDLAENPMESVGDPPPLPEAIANSETEVNTPSQEDPKIAISDSPTLQEDPETVMVDPPLIPEVTIDLDETSNPPSLDEDPPVPIDPPTSPEAIPGQFIVKLNPNLRSSDLSDLRTSMGAEVLGTTNMGIQLWQIPGMDAFTAKASFRNDPRIEYIEPNYLRSLAQTPDDPEFGQLWGLNNTGQTGGTPDADIDAPEAWDISTGSSDVVVGVIDTGVDYNHPDLAANIWTNPGEVAGDGIDNDDNGYVDDVHGYDFSDGDSDPFDDDGHGTHVAGTIGAVGDNSTGVVGANWSAQIMALKIFPNATDFNIIQAIEYSANMGVKITNNSWGGGPPSEALEDAIAYAGDAGQLFVAAAGNYSSDNDVNPFYPASFDLDNIVSVAATDHNDQLADFSNYGATTVDLGAPGVDVYSTFPNNSYDYLSGTSMASPHVAGVASLLWSQNPDLTAAEVKNILLSSADPIPALDGITVSGGRLNAYQALLAPVAAKIQGSKWNDADGDGTWDSNESALPGWTIYLDANNNGTLDDGETSTLTNASGQYVFPFLTPGTYTVAEVLKPGWTQTAPTSPGTYTVELEEEEIVSDLNFGNQLTNPASISGSKWNDGDADGEWDTTENSLSDWTIYLDNNNNGTLDEGELSTVTDENGEYSFTDLEPGTYTVAEVIEPGWGQTYPETSQPRLGNGTHTVELEADENATDINFGNYELPPGNISGSKWHDLDGDSIRDDGEPGLEGWTIYLDANQNGQLDDGELSTVTDEDGNYAFTDLPFGTYTVSEELQPTWVQTYPGVSNFLDEPNDTIPDSVVSGIIDKGIVNTTGFIGDNANISPESDVDFIKVDLEEGDRLTLDIDAETFGSSLDSILRVFDSTGTQLAVNDDYDGLDSYIDFTASYADTYYVGVSGYDNFSYDPFIEGSGYGGTGDYNLTITVGDGTSSPLLGSHVFFLEPGETRSNIDFGNWQPITLSGTKWHDLDGDGTQDTDEAALPGWTIYLDANNNSQLDEGETSTFTDAEGNYSFTLPEGTYTVAEVQQTGWVQTAPTDGSYTVSLDAGEVADDLDFGNQALPVTISGAKWNDLNGNSIRDEGEPGIEGWTIYLDTNNSGILDEGDLSTLTDQDGNYSFTNLPFGNYTVSEEVPATWEQTSPGYFYNASHYVYLNPGETFSGLDFGNWQPSFITGTKWHDIDADGTQDAEEPGLKGWTIYLDANNNGQLDNGETSTVTDANGNYSLKVGTGTYTVAEVQKTGWIQTAPADGSQTVSIAPGEVKDVDFGNQAQPGEIHGSKWNDQDADGEWDATEPGLEGWTIYLDTNKNGQLDDGELSTVTDADGNYSFTDLPYGSYSVVEEQQPDWEQTSPNGFANQVTQLTDNNVGDFSSDVSGNQVVWSGYDGVDDNEIYLNDGSQVLQLTNNQLNEYSPQISDGNVVWQGYDGVDDDEIYLYQGGEVVQLTDNQTYEYNVQISGNNVVWTQEYHDDNYNYYSDIYLYDGSQVVQLTDNDYYKYDVQLSGNKVVWSAYDGNDNEIYLYDGSQVVQLTNNDVDEYSSDIDGNKVVWQGYGVNYSEIYLYDGNQVVRLTDNYDYEYSPQISEGNVIWQSYDGVDDDEIYLYDGSQVVQITDNQSYEYGVQISGNQLAWYAYNYDYDDDSEIYVYDGSQVVQLTDNDYYEYNPQISGGNVVWSSFDGTDDEIYTYGQGNTYPVSVQPGEIVTDINFGNHSQNPEDDILTGTPQPDEIEGKGGNDRISGLAEEDTLKGGSGNDTVFGGDGDDVIVGQQDNDRLYGEKGDDGVRGNTGDDLVVGGEGSDRVYGGQGMDTLIGVDPEASQPGVGEIDLLHGVEGGDRFVLGDASNVYYDDGDDTTSGLSDYASIEDFVLGQNVIQLSGNSSDYVLATSPSGLPSGTAIFLETGSTDELIGIVRNISVTQLDLTGSAFSYV